MALAALATLLAGCAVPAPVTGSAERAARAESDLHVMFDGQPPLTGPVTLGTATERALRVNFDGRLKQMELAVALDIAELAATGMLPRLTGRAGLYGRDNDLAASSIGTISGTPSIEPLSSSDRRSGSASLGVAWNVLDFGVGYLLARQDSNKALVADERRRRVAQTLALQVRAAYGQALAEQRLRDDVDQLAARVAAALASPLAQDLEARRSLLESARQLGLVRRELAYGHAELASLMALRPGQDFTLALPPKAGPPAAAPDPAQLERQALLDRPELREEDYQTRIDADEVRKAMLRLLPGIEFSGGINWDSTSFLVNKRWADAGVHLTWNLMNILSGGGDIRLAERQQELGQVRRLAVAMAVLTQVDLAALRLRLARQDHAAARDLAEVEEQLYQRALAAPTGEVDMIVRAENRLFARLHSLQAWVEEDSATANLQVSIGADPQAMPPAGPPDEPRVVEPMAAPVPPPAPPPPPPPAPAARAHLGSYRSEAGARRGWQVLAARADLSALRAVTEAVDLPGQGHFIRLYAEGERPLLTQLCERLHAGRLYCEVRRAGPGTE